MQIQREENHQGKLTASKTDTTQATTTVSASDDLSAEDAAAKGMDCPKRVKW